MPNYTTARTTGSELPLTYQDVVVKLLKKNSCDLSVSNDLAANQLKLASWLFRHHILSENRSDHDDSLRFIENEI